MKTVDLQADYEVANGDVKLTIVIGNAQIGSSVVKLGSKEIARGQVDKELLGQGPKIKGKALQAKSVVTDVNDRTNKTSIKYKLTGGRRSQEFVSAGTVDQNGDSIIYRAKFNLVS